VINKQRYSGSIVAELDAFLNFLETPIHSLYAITRNHPDGRVEELAATLLMIWSDEYGRQNPGGEPPPVA
jgi:hypothetical protein